MKPLERLKKLNTKENLWVFLLILLKEKSLYGWEIPELVKKRFLFKPGRITPYRVLYRLEKEGLVKSEIKERKRIYKITSSGIKELEGAKIFLRELLKWIEG